MGLKVVRPKQLKSNPELKFPFSEGGGSSTLQLLMLSPKMLKSKISIFGGGGGVSSISQLLMLSSNLLKLKKNFYKGFFKIFLSFRAKSVLG